MQHSQMIHYRWATAAPYNCRITGETRSVSRRVGETSPLRAPGFSMIANKQSSFLVSQCRAKDAFEKTSYRIETFLIHQTSISYPIAVTRNQG